MLQKKELFTNVLDEMNIGQVNHESRYRIRQSQSKTGDKFGHFLTKKLDPCAGQGTGETYLLGIEVDRIVPIKEFHEGHDARMSLARYEDFAVRHLIRLHIEDV